MKLPKNEERVSFSKSLTVFTYLIPPFAAIFYFGKLHIPVNLLFFF